MSHSVEHLRQEIRELARKEEQESQTFIAQSATAEVRPPGDSLAELGLWLAIVAAIIFGGLAASVWALAWFLRSLTRGVSEGWHRGQQPRQ